MNAQVMVEESFLDLAPWVAMPGLRSGLSFETGMRRCLGRTELYDRIARRFLAARVDEARKLQAALDAGDRDTLRQLAHDLTSTAGTLGADALSATALALQMALEAGAPHDALTPLVHLFSREHAVVLTGLAAYARGEVDLQVFATRKS